MTTGSGLTLTEVSVPCSAAEF